MKSVGQKVARKDGFAKVTGVATYIDDLHFPGLLHARTVRSTVAAGTIQEIRQHLPRGGAGYVVVDYRDIPGRNVHALIQDDQPMLAEKRILHYAEPILLVAHEDRLALAAAEFEIRYAETKPCFDPERSRKVFHEVRIAKGDLAQGFAAADLILEGEYSTPHQEQLYIEPNGVIAVPEAGGITIYGSLQCPYYVHKAMVKLLALPPAAVRIVQVETGGGFGGKEEYPSMIAGHAALLALKAQRPVKLIYDRVEDMEATTKRHPSLVRHRTGVKRDGTLVAMEVDVLMDGGAYATLSPVVLSRGVLHASGPYRCDHVQIVGRVVRTNTPPNGAFRGFGAPQTLFAIEVHMERIAENLGLDSIRLRERNALRAGDTTATGQKLGRDTSALAVLRAAVKRSDYRAKRKAYKGTSRSIGLSLFFHGAGFTGAGEDRLASQAALELTPSGVRILVASTEIGQGTRTMHAQIVADAMRLPYEAVEVAEADTAIVPDSGPTVASRTCMVVGKMLQRCAETMRKKLGALSPAQYLERHGPLIVRESYLKPDTLQWDEQTYRGDAYGAYAWGCNVAEIELDPATLQVRPLRLTAVVEIGKAIHPLLAAGQVEGGSAQGVGWALLEEVILREGRMANANLTSYLLPTTLDTPIFDVEILERSYSHGPYGAKGVGELPMDGPAPALVNALRAQGFDLRRIPATPERLLELS